MAYYFLIALLNIFKKLKYSNKLDFIDNDREINFFILNKKNVLF